MARVTVEDCVEVVTNRFELVALASERAKNIAAGAQLTVDRDNDKNAVVALREIAERTVPVESLREAVILQNQRYGNLEVQPEFDDAESEDSLAAGLTEEIRGFSHQSDFDDADLDIDADTDGLGFDEDNLDVED